ncbi:allantoicase [Leucothrix arctica]|uniref:Probable allantoicase n=1 Tax=Leucothrix arctica TaxID=1481894 RepID=A0A317CG15_9GAMM|nr:allantoicase [Leucothrix arctica]PWQ97495.1 allantoicase [Leucothrix arctica]
MSSHTNTLIFSEPTNLADPRLGAEVIYATDDFFADKARLIKPEPAVFIDGKFDDNGKWMDGWETRRKRHEGYDYCIIKLGGKATLHSFLVDTSHFTGNYPAAASIDACASSTDDVLGDDIVWTELVVSTPLEGNSQRKFELDTDATFTHIRLNIYPDGGIARLRVYGQLQHDWDKLAAEGSIDLVSALNGGRAVVTNDEHFGAATNIINPGRGVNMGDGWETRRRREPGNDWAIFELACAGEIETIEVDTAHFKGNFPDQCSIQAAFVDYGTDESLVPQSIFWRELLPPQSLSMDAIARFEKEIIALGKISHIRLNTFPDGGISRLRMFGKVVTD